MDAKAGEPRTDPLKAKSSGIGEGRTC
jgi:hypothetical protein